TVVNNGTDVSFDPDGDFDSLAVGESEVVTFTYTAVAAGSGESTTETVTVTVTGTNDGPVAVDDSGSVDEDATLAVPVLTGTLSNDTDADTSDVLTVSDIRTGAEGGSGTSGLVGGPLTGTYGTLTVQSDGSYSYSADQTAANALANGDVVTDVFTYTIDDGNGGADTAQLTITVTGTNDAPVAVDDTSAVDEDGSLVVNQADGLVDSNDTDPDGDTLTITTGDGTTTGTYGTLVLATDGSYTYDADQAAANALAAGETATDTFTYVVSDGEGGSDSATLTITVTGTNDGPTAVDDSATTDEDTAVLNIDLLGDDTDPDGDTLSLIEIDGIAAGGNITLASGAIVTVNGDGTVDYDPNGQFNGLDDTEVATDTFTYTITDGNGGTDTATVTVTINGNDDATVINPDFGTTDESTAIDIDVLDNDSDVDTSDNPLTVASVDTSGLAGGSVTNNTSNVTFDPGTDFDDLAVGESEVVTFTYTTNTGSTETVTVTVTGTNDGPVAVDDNGSVDEDATLAVSVLTGVISNDTDADTSDVLTVSDIRTGAEGGSGTTGLVGNPLVGTYGTLTLNSDGSYSYAADQDAADPLAVGVTATDTFTYEISDGNGGTDTAELVITVTGTNDAPLPNPPGGTPGVDPGVYDDEDTIAEDVVAPATGNVLANDVDPDTGDVLEVSEVNGVAANVANPVVGTYGTVTIDADGGYSYALDNTNPVVQALAVGESTTETFTYTADDTNGGTATATLTITITGTNDVPPSNPPGGTPGVDFGVYDDANSIAEDEFPNSVIGNVLDNDLDPDGDTLTVSEVVGSAANTGSQVDGSYGTVVIDEDGSYSYTLDNSNPTVQALGLGQSTADTFTYTADDGNGGTATATLTITITGTNDGPTAVDDNALPTAMDDNGITNQDSTVLIDVITNDTDPDPGDALLISAVDQPARGSVSISSENEILFDPGSDFDYLGAMESETVTFDYLLSDGEGGTDTATVTVTVNGLDDATLTAPDAEQTDEGSAVTIDVLANDTDPDSNDNPLSIASVTQPADANDGIVVNNAGDLTFTPGSNFDILGPGESATTTFTYTTDTGVTETVTVTVNGVNYAPNAADDSVVAFRNRPVTLNLTSNDDDPDGDPLTVVSAGGASNGTVSIDPVSGNVIYTPDSGFTGNDSFTYTISDGNGGIDVASVDVTVLSQPGNRDGIWGGHFDLDYDTSLGGDTEGHHHAYDDDFDVLGVDYFNALGNKFSGVNDEVNTSQQFKIIVANGDLSPSARISINQIYDENDPSTYISVTDYDDIALEDLTVFSLNGNGGTTQLTDLSIMFPVTAMAEAGFLPSQTGAVRGNTPGADGEWRNGAITLQLVEVNGGADNFTTDLSLSNGGVQGVATSGLVYESTIFWHWDGPTYDDNSPYVPGDPSSVAAYVEPIVIDLDGDGVEFDGVSDGITFDVDGDGIAERTAWANQDDGVLVYDENDNNNLDGRSEFAFADYSDNPDATDLEGLRHFDTNNDLILDANDDEFESFKLWQDRDGDGEVGEGEMMTLEEAGIESLELTSDGEAYYTAGGDVMVNGEAGVNYADGSKGVLADAEFRYEELASDDESLEVVADDGQVIDVNADETVPEPVGEDLLAGEGGQTSGPEAAPDEAGSASGTSIDDDMAAADAAMS
ncbi:MAG: Ig-like domain-containing protein, partial [Verrucomicrobiales bacterium]|nr:Ig-like domain-containing protein [Verrucomicrobiales bacterium]